MTGSRRAVVTVTLNVAVDLTLDCPDFTVNAVNRARRAAETAGGKGINVASFLADGEGPVAAAGFLGRDNAGLFEALFARKGIDDRCMRLDGAARVNIKVADPARRTVTDINLPGLAIDASDLARLDAQLDALADGRPAFVLAGSLPAGVPEDIYAGLTRRLRARGCFVAVDASGGALRHAVTAGPDMVKPNIHELSELLGRRLDGIDAVARAAWELRTMGIGLAVVSMGEQGALFADETGVLLATPPEVTVASTVGAGDAMVAGVLAARLSGCDLATCARRGTAYAAGTLGLPGPELPGPDTLETLMRAVRVEPIADL